MNSNRKFHIFLHREGISQKFFDKNIIGNIIEIQFNELIIRIKVVGSKILKILIIFVFKI